VVVQLSDWRESESIVLCSSLYSDDDWHYSHKSKGAHFPKGGSFDRIRETRVQKMWLLHPLKSPDRIRARVTLIASVIIKNMTLSFLCSGKSYAKFCYGRVVLMGFCESCCRRCTSILVVKVFAGKVCGIHFRQYHWNRSFFIVKVGHMNEGSAYFQPTACAGQQGLGGWHQDFILPWWFSIEKPLGTYPILFHQGIYHSTISLTTRTIYSVCKVLVIM
jgi:hypothetical protein